MPRSGARKPDELALVGLAQSWNKSQKIRTNMLKTGRLCVWDTPETVGVLTLETMSANFRALKKMLEIWLPKIDVLKTVNVYAARREAMFSLGCFANFILLILAPCYVSLSSCLLICRSGNFGRSWRCPRMRSRWFVMRAVSKDS